MSFGLIGLNCRESLHCPNVVKLSNQIKLTRSALPLLPLSTVHITWKWCLYINLRLSGIKWCDMSVPVASVDAVRVLSSVNCVSRYPPYICDTQHGNTFLSICLSFGQYLRLISTFSFVGRILPESGKFVNNSMHYTMVQRRVKTTVAGKKNLLLVVV